MEDTYFVELYLLFYKTILKYILDQLIASVFQILLLKEKSVPVTT